MLMADLYITGKQGFISITLYVYTGKDGNFTLYEDDGLQYNYEKENNSHRHKAISCLYSVPKKFQEGNFYNAVYLDILVIKDLN